MDSKMLKLPSSWAAVKLGDFVENEKGKKPKNESKAKTASHYIPYVDIQAFEENVIRTWTDGVGCRLCYETDFLMVWDGSRSGLVGKGMNGALGSTLVRIYFPSMVNDYAFYFLQSKYQQINTRAKGVGIPHVDPALLWNYDFPIAPLNEQHRIVAKIEELFSELDKGIENLKTAQAQLKVYRQALLKHAFEGKLTAQWRAEHQAKGKLSSVDEALRRIKPIPRPNRWKTKTKDTIVGHSVLAVGNPRTSLPEGWRWVPMVDILARAYQHHAQDKSNLVHFGHVKIEKIAHLVEAHLGIDLEREPIKDAAGPNDYPHLMKVESRARKANWFDVRKKKDADAYVFSKKHGFDALLLKTANALGNRAGAVDELMAKLVKLDTQRTEIVATLYAAWNNLLLLGQSPSDEEIVHEARENWHASKLKIERARFFKALEWMRRKELVPSGKGRYVDVKGKRKATRRPS